MTGSLRFRILKQGFCQSIILLQTVYFDKIVLVIRYVYSPVQFRKARGTKCLNLSTFLGQIRYPRGFVLSLIHFIEIYRMTCHCKDEPFGVFYILRRKKLFMLLMHGVNYRGIGLLSERHIPGVFFCVLFSPRGMIDLCVKAEIFNSSRNRVVLDQLKLHFVQQSWIFIAYPPLYPHRAEAGGNGSPAVSLNDQIDGLDLLKLFILKPLPGIQLIFQCFGAKLKNIFLKIVFGIFADIGSVRATHVKACLCRLLTVYAFRFAQMV